MQIKAIIDTRAAPDAIGFSPTDPLAGVPLFLWPAFQLLRGGIAAEHIAVIDPEQRCATLIAHHAFRTIDAPPANAEALLRANWQTPFAVHGHPSQLPNAITAIRITDDDTFQLAQTVAYGLFVTSPPTNAIRRYTLPTDTDFRAVISDVDGCLTDGTVTRTESGDAMRAFNTKDGIGHRKLQAAGIKIGWLSTAMECKSIHDRAKSLGVDAIDAGSGHKGPRFEALCQKLAVDPRHTVFLGDDIHDLPAMRLAGAMACPSDAHPDVQRECDLVLSTPGGRGAFRELADRLTAHITEDQLKI